MTNELYLLRERITELEEALGLTVVQPHPLLTKPHQAQMLGMLLKQAVVSKEGAWIAMFSDLPRRERPKKQYIVTIVSLLRTELRRHGIKIKTHYGAGWSLDAEGRKKAGALFGIAPAKAKEAA